MAEHVRVVLNLKMDRAAWEKEYSIDTASPDYVFEDAVQEWFADECLTLNELGEWPNVERITG